MTAEDMQFLVQGLAPELTKAEAEEVLERMRGSDSSSLQLHRCWQFFFQSSCGSLLDGVARSLFTAGASNVSRRLQIASAIRPPCDFAFEVSSGYPRLFLTKLEWGSERCQLLIAVSAGCGLFCVIFIT